MGIIISTKILISSEIIMAPIESRIVVKITSLDTGFNRSDSARGSFFLVRKNKMGTIKNPCPTNMAIYVERPGLAPERIDGSNALNNDPMIRAEMTDKRTIKNANRTERVRFIGVHIHVFHNLVIYHIQTQWRNNPLLCQSM